MLLAKYESVVPFCFLFQKQGSIKKKKKKKKKKIPLKPNDVIVMASMDR